MSNNNTVYGGQGIFTNTKSWLRLFFRRLAISTLLGLAFAIFWVSQNATYSSFTDAIAIQEAKLRCAGWTMPGRVVPYLVTKYLFEEPAGLITEQERRDILQMYRAWDGDKFLASSYEILTNDEVNLNADLFVQNIIYGFWYGVASTPCFFLLLCMLNVLRRRYLNAKRFGKKKSHANPFGSSKLATPKEIKKYLAKKGLPIGLLPKRSINTTNLDVALKKLRKQKSGKLINLPTDHTIVVAPTRSGKGIGIIVPAILNHDGGVFVLDPKAELTCITKRYRESLDKKVYVFDPKNRSGQANCQINILDYLSKDEDILCSDIKELVKLICPIPPNSSPTVSHFVDSGRSCIELMLLYMFFEKKEQEHNLSALYDMLTMNTEKFTDMLEASSNSDIANGALSRAANSILSTAPNELSGVLSTARNSLSFIDEPYTRKATQVSTTSLQSFGNDDVDLFLCCELNEDGTANKMTQLLTNIIFRTIKDNRNKFNNLDRLMVFDELPAMGYLGFVSQALVLGAGYGMKILAIFQSLEKIKATYPNDWQTFLESSLAIFMNCKGEAAKYVSDRIGITTINVESESTGTSEQSRQGQMSQNTSQQSGLTQSLTQRHLLTPSEITSFGTDIIIAFYSNCSPIVCRRLNYLTDTFWRGKFDDNPLQKNNSHTKIRPCKQAQFKSSL